MRTVAAIGIPVMIWSCFEAEIWAQELRTDRDLIAILLEEDLGNRSFGFSTVLEAATGKKVIPLDPSDRAHRRVIAAIETAIRAVIHSMNAKDSPVRGLRRINEASRHFENALLLQLNQTAGIACEIPQNADGKRSRSGYPDLRIVDVISGTVFYLDPKLVERTALESTLRSFYYEPRRGTGKIRDDAVHLLIGIEHDGMQGDWTFDKWRVVDLSSVILNLKAEFQSSNEKIYRKSHSLLPSTLQDDQDSLRP